MNLWLCILLVLVALYFVCAIAHTVYMISKVNSDNVTITIIGFKGWLVVFFLWPISILIDALIDDMMM